jgi:hypothetical protein
MTVFSLALDSNVFTSGYHRKLSTSHSPLWPETFLLKLAQQQSAEKVSLFHFFFVAKNRFLLEFSTGKLFFTAQS